MSVLEAIVMPTLINTTEGLTGESLVMYLAS